MKLLAVDSNGFDLMDRKLLMMLIERFDGGPAGLDNLAAAIGEARDTIEDVIEPYLIQQGYLKRTPRGRIARSQESRVGKQCVTCRSRLSPSLYKKNKHN